jgi:tetratricopeptide (TPR) repeat protein
MRERVVVVALCATSLMLGGCATRTVHVEHLKARQGEAAQELASGGSLSDYMAKIRHLSSRPVTKSTGVGTVEARDPALARALAELAFAPSAERYRAVGERYRVLGVLDAAYTHFTQAATRDPFHAAAFDGLARVWRDWGLPHLALGDAYRAVAYAPRSAAAHNTLGTVLQALGNRRHAQRSYERASQLDSNAAYAINNLCYLHFREGEVGRAIAMCEVALQLDPALGAARNNLALAQAAGGRQDLARLTLMDAPTEAEGLFNVGILHMAGRDYVQAAAAFDAASRAEPLLNAARTRAAQARELAHRTALSN